ncbi:MAG: hypothetical protein ACRDGA_10395, partial [Bacteroidota bacterium]
MNDECRRTVTLGWEDSPPQADEPVAQNLRMSRHSGMPYPDAGNSIGTTPSNFLAGVPGFEP